MVDIKCPMSVERDFVAKGRVLKLLQEEVRELELTARITNGCLISRRSRSTPERGNE